MTASSASATVDSSGGVNIPVQIEQITQPVTESSRKLYQKISGGAQWYGEQWEDLLIEAKHKALGAESHHTAGDILAALGAAKIASDLPGRVRVRLKELRWQDRLLGDVSSALGSLPGIQQVDTNSVTGSILVHYDKNLYSSLQDLMQAVTGR